MTPEQRRLARLSKALAEAESKLASTRREDYTREVDYRRVLTMRQHKVAGLKKTIGGKMAFHHIDGTANHQT